MPSPPSPFQPFDFSLPSGSVLVRVFTPATGRKATTFNSGAGSGAGGRSSFFGNPVVPVLYAAETEIAAVCETVPHDVPASGGAVTSSAVDRLVASKIVTTQPLRLADFAGIGLRRLGVEPEELTAAPAREYFRTVRWAQAAHEAGFAGLVRMSKRCNSDRVYVLFGDRVDAATLNIADDYGRVFAAGPDRDWLIDFCGSVNVDVLAPSG